MKKIKSLNIILILVISIVVVNITVPCIVKAQEAKNIFLTQNDSQSEIDDIENVDIYDESDELQDFSSGIQAMVYAQEKLKNRVNFSTSLYAGISMSVAMFKFSVELKAKTVVNSDGVVYTNEACNMFEKWLNGQKGFEYYSKKDSNYVYTRETMDVTYDTCVATFKGNYRVLEVDQALTEFGYIDNSKIIEINNNSVSKVESFTKTDSGYEMTFRMNTKDSEVGSEAKQKFLRCSELVRRPSLSKLIITCKMDLYGNITNMHYSISAYGTKKLDGIGEFSAPIDIEIDQTYSYKNQNLLIPTVIEF